MCTVSWRLRSDGYDLLFNRDENRLRLPAHPPALRKTAAGSGFLAPIDSNGGGTWIFVNEHRLCAVVLNYYGTDADPAGNGVVRSRGRLLLDLADARDGAAFLERLRQSIKEWRYEPCLFLVIDPENDTFLCRWTGKKLARLRVPRHPVVTTSSCETEIVTDARRRAFVESFDEPRNPDLAGLRSFHWRYDPDSPAASVLMSRPDARTVSFTHVAVSGRMTEMEYCGVTDASPPAPDVLHRCRLTGYHRFGCADMS